MMQVPDDISQLTEAQLSALLNLDQPRGTRNNNPGNIEDGPWARSQPGYAGTDGRFALFETLDAGRAANDALMKRYGEQGYNTPAKIIARYAPPNENNTQAYINTVASALGVQPNEQINLDDPRVRQAITEAIHGVENGSGGSQSLQSLGDEDLNVLAFGAKGTQDDPIDLVTAGAENGNLLVKGTWVKGPDGTIYALPESASPGAQRIGDTPQQGGLVVRPQSAFEDAALSGATGIVEGATGTLGMLGDVQNLMGGSNPAMGAAGLVNLPDTAQLNKMVEATGADFHDPQTMGGEYARTVGQFLPGVLAPGGAGMKAASWLVPALASETAGQLTEGTPMEPWARTGAGLVGAGGVGLAGALRGGPTNVLANATRGVDPQQIRLAEVLRQQSPIPLTAAEAIQQTTGGATGLGRVQRVVEGASNRLAPMMAQRPQAVRGAVDDLISQIGPAVEPQAASGIGQESAAGVIDTMRRRVNESARPFYDRMAGQEVSPTDLATLQANPSYAQAEAAVTGNPELAALLSGSPADVSTINRVIQQLDAMQAGATPGVFNPQGNMTLASQRGGAGGLARQLAEQASPDFATARQTVRTGQEAFVEPLKRGPLGVIAGQPELKPTLTQQTGALFPAAPAEGGADESLRAIRLMNEVNPQAGAALTRQHLATQANEALQANQTGPNQFGGAKLAAQLMGNPEQERTLLGAIDMAAPNNNARILADALRATGTREPAGSNTAFNAQMMSDLKGGNLVQEGIRTGTNPGGIVGRVTSLWDNAMTERNAAKLAEILMLPPEEATAAILQAQLRRPGGNRARLANTLIQSREE